MWSRPTSPIRVQANQGSDGRMADTGKSSTMRPSASSSVHTNVGSRLTPRPHSTALTIARHLGVVLVIAMSSAPRSSNPMTSSSPPQVATMAGPDGSNLGTTSKEKYSAEEPKRMDGGGVVAAPLSKPTNTGSR